MPDNDATKAHPKDGANFVSRIFLYWIVNLLWRGSKNPLNHADLDPVREVDCASRCTKRLENVWQNEIFSARQKKSKPKLWKAMLKYFTLQEYAFGVFLTVFNAIGNAVFLYSTINLMKVFGDFEKGTHSPEENVIYIWGMIVGMLIETLGSQHFCLLMPLLGIRARAALVGVIYKKVRTIARV